MRESLINRIIEFLRRHLLQKRWRRVATCMAAVVVFCTTYLLMLPAISMTKSAVSLSAEKLSAWSGDPLSVRVSAHTEEDEDRKIFVLVSKGAGAELSGSYVFDEDGVCVITDEEGRKIELHRVFREKKKTSEEEDITADYWFSLEGGEQTAFTLQLSDEVDEERFLLAAEAVKSAAEQADAAADQGAEATATGSDADRKAEKQQEREQEKATGSDGQRAASAPLRAASVSDALKVEETDEEDGLAQLSDGEIVNDLPADEADETGEPTETVAFLEFSAGSGKVLSEAVKDAEKNADKRGDGRLKFTWKGIAESVFITPEMVWSGDGAHVAVIFDGDAMLPADAVLSVEEIEPGTDEYEAYLAQAVSVVRASGSDATKEMGVDYARFFDICILDGDGNELEPAAPVKVVITYDEAVSVEDGGDLNVMHFHEENTPEVLETEKNEILRDIPEERDGGSSAGAGLDVDALSFTTERFSVFGVVRTVIEKLILASDGQNYKITVTYRTDTGIPENADLAVEEILPAEGSKDGQSDIWQEYSSRVGKALGWDGESASYLRLFDIKIVDKDDPGVKYQPAEGTAVDVRIELADKKVSKEAADNTRVVHFADGTGEGEVISSLEVDGGTVSFEAKGFSTYAIVEGPASVPVGWSKVTTVSELISMGSEGLYIGHPDGYYYCNSLTGDASRMGITKTKPAQSYPAQGAVKYYFEPVEGTDNKVCAYCYADDGITKQYVYNGGNNSLTFVSEDQKTVFTVTQNSNGTFKLNNGAWYWNMQGGANGTRFCSYNNANDANNNVNFWYYTDSPDDPYGLNNASYGLMFWDQSLYGKGMMASSGNVNALDAEPLTVLATADNSKHLFVSNDSDISVWTFHWVDDDQYYLTTTVDGSTKYLKIGAGGLSLVDTESQTSPVRVIPGSGTHAGQICLRSGDVTLTYSGTTASGFSTGGSVGSEWLNLVDVSSLGPDYFKTYSARKVSVSDTGITTGSKVIVYTRAWNEQNLKYEYFAINYDGTLVRCYENGDSIEWVGNVTNTMPWQFTEYTDDQQNPNYYYELYNEYAGQVFKPPYLAPQVTGGKIVNDAPVGINMNGRRYGQYYSTILAWDAANYSYAGLKVENGKIVSCPKSEAMDFYFAVMEEIPVDDSLTTVKTVDHTQYGITMKLQNYNGEIIKGDGATSTKKQHEVMGSTVFTQWNAQPGLLSTKLGENGYPTVISTNKSLYELYNGAKEVNHLFIESTFNASGYYEYDSAQTFASLKGADHGDFTVFKELGTYDASNKNTLKHGQFLPFNEIEAGRFASVNGQNLYSVAGTLLPDSDPRKYENLYLVRNKEDLYFGAELEASFTQTPDGLDDWGHDIIFEFTGDDDFWLYVDGELVIDLGGIHSALPGSVNFSTGDVSVNGQPLKLLDIYRDNFKSRNSITDDNDPRVIDFLKQYFAYDETTGKFSPIFKDYSTHTMKIFYMERGGGASNLHMRFNLASVKPGTVELSKKLDGVDATESPLAEFAYQIKYKYKDGTEHLLTNRRPGNSDTEDYVFYKNTDSPVTFKESMDMGGRLYKNVFILKPDETVVINFPKRGEEEIDSYSIIECGVNTVVYKNVYANGSGLEGKDAAENRKDYGISFMSTDDRQRVNYVNEVDPEAMRTLTFSKKLYDADGTTPIHDDATTFNFRLYFCTESDPELTLANMYTYHVKDAEGNYCRWDANGQKFEKIGAGITDYSALSDDEKVKASFSTSMNGTISMIPVDYFVEVRQILAGTRYKVQERPNEIPDGYSFQKYVYKADINDEGPTETYSGGDTVAAAGAPDREDQHDVIATGKDPHIDICNLKGWGLRMNKVWTDADYMAGRDNTYFAVYTRNSAGDLTIVRDSLRKLPYGTTTLYWYWLKLPVQDVSFEDYVIREVKVTGGTPVFDEEGAVTNQDSLTIKYIAEGGELKLKGRQKGETKEAEFTYTVRYKPGTISQESNVRVDTVTNDRPGIILKKEDWSGQALAGAVFTLADSNHDLIGTFTSDEEGYITTAFLSDNKTYILTETAAPQGYHGLESAMTIWVDTSDTGTGTNGSTVKVSGVEEAYYSLTQAVGTTPSKLIIKDRPYELRAVKQDGDTQSKLEGVHFELHKQITVGGITHFEESVMTGYEDLVTDPDGVIPKIDRTLPAGTYQLREKQALNGYQALPGHIEFTVSITGAVSLLPSMSSADWVILNSAAEEGTDALVYTMTILNYIDTSVTLRKVNENGEDLPGSKFSLCKHSGNNWEVVSRYSEIDLTKQSQITLTRLSAGRYRLEETLAPDKYVILTKYIYFNIDQDGNVSLTDESGAGANSNENAVLSGTGSLITVKNDRGTALPATGGSGTRAITLTGALLTAAAGALFLFRRRTRREH